MGIQNDNKAKPKMTENQINDVEIAVNVDESVKMIDMMKHLNENEAVGPSWLVATIFYIIFLIILYVCSVGMTIGLYLSVSSMKKTFFDLSFRSFYGFSCQLDFLCSLRDVSEKRKH